MNNEKLIIISKRLQHDHVVSFRLYNALYKITYFNGKFYIHQNGLETVYSYSSLKELFHQYVVYGSVLFNILDDIKLT